MGDDASMAAAVPWRPSPWAPRVYVKDLGTSEGHVIQLVRYDAGGVAIIEGAAGGAFLYVLSGELIHAGRRFWPGAAVVIAPSPAAEARSDSGCTVLAVHRLEQPPARETSARPERP